MHIVLSCQELKFILVGFLILNLYWRGSPAVGEWCGTENVLQIEEMIVDLTTKCES